MLWVIIAYVLICAMVADTVTSLAFSPALREAQRSGVDNEFTRSPNLAYFTQFVSTMLLTPIFLVIVHMPRVWESYVSATRRVVLEQREI